MAKKCEQTCELYTDVESKIGTIDVVIGKVSQSQERLEAVVTAMSENLTVLVSHSVRIDRLEKDREEHLGSDRELWNLARETEKKVSVALDQNEKSRAAAIEDRATLRQIGGWAISIALAASGAVWSLFNWTRE